MKINKRYCFDKSKSTVREFVYPSQKPKYKVDVMSNTNEVLKIDLLPSHLK